MKRRKIERLIAAIVLIAISFFAAHMTQEYSKIVNNTWAYILVQVLFPVSMAAMGIFIYKGRKWAISIALAITLIAALFGVFMNYILLGYVGRYLANTESLMVIMMLLIPLTGSILLIRNLK